MREPPPVIGDANGIPAEPILAERIVSQDHEILRMTEGVAM
jgi:hypothetical protein